MVLAIVLVLPAWDAARTGGAGCRQGHHLRPCWPVRRPMIKWGIPQGISASGSLDSRAPAWHLSLALPSRRC